MDGLNPSTWNDRNTSNGSNSQLVPSNIKALNRLLLRLKPQESAKFLVVKTYTFSARIKAIWMSEHTARYQRPVWAQMPLQALQRLLLLTRVHDLVRAK